MWEWGRVLDGLTLTSYILNFQYIASFNINNHKGAVNIGYFFLFFWFKSMAIVTVVTEVESITKYSWVYEFIMLV